MTWFRVSAVLWLCACGSTHLRGWSYDTPSPDPNMVKLPVGHADEVGVSVDGVTSFVANRSLKQSKYFHSVSLARHGRVVFEVGDTPQRIQQTQDLRSVTKSITALLVLMAVERGELALEDPVVRVLPLLKGGADPRWQSMTVDHLLSMRSGLDCDDRDRRSTGQEDRMYRSTDWLQFWAASPFVEAPGTSGRYCTGNVIALGAILEAVTAMSLVDLAQRDLFQPLGISQPQWARYGVKGSGVDSGGHLELTPRQLLAIGQAVLDGYRERPSPVSSLVVEWAMAPQTSLGRRPYGRLWWLAGWQTQGGPEPRGGRLWFASGNGGQYLIIAPELEVVAVLTGDAYNRPEAGLPLMWFSTELLPAIDRTP